MYVWSLRVLFLSGFILSMKCLQKVSCQNLFDKEVKILMAKWLSLSVVNIIHALKLHSVFQNTQPCFELSNVHPFYTLEVVALVATSALG